MSRLEDLKPNASVQGVLPNGLVTVVSAKIYDRDSQFPRPAAYPAG